MDNKVDKLIEKLRDKESGGVRKEAASALGKIGDERAVELLVKALQDRNYDVREETASALRNLGYDHMIY